MESQRFIKQRNFFSLVSGGGVVFVGVYKLLFFSFVGDYKIKYHNDYRTDNNMIKCKMNIYELVIGFQCLKLKLFKKMMSSHGVH